MNTHHYIVEASYAGQRADKGLAELSGFSRSKIQALIKDGHITINDVIPNANNKLSEGGRVTIHVPEAPEQVIKHHETKLDIVYEDDDIIVIDKPAGLTVHPGAGNHNDTLVNVLVAQYGDNLSAVGGDERPGIVHRLDRETSGLMIIAKNDPAHESLSRAMAAREINKWYKALIWGHMAPSSGTINAGIARSDRDRKRMMVSEDVGSREAITHYDTISSWQYISLVECKLETGRTHQIRVHFSNAGHSVVGDKVYGNNARKIAYYTKDKQREVITGLKRHALHSYKLEFAHPISGERLEFTSELPEDIVQVIRCLEGD